MWELTAVSIQCCRQDPLPELGRASTASHNCLTAVTWAVSDEWIYLPWKDWEPGPLRHIHLLREGAGSLPPLERRDGTVRMLGDCGADSGELRAHKALLPRQVTIDHDGGHVLRHQLGLETGAQTAS
jgi:hypothetical protein